MNINPVNSVDNIENEINLAVGQLSSVTSKSDAIVSKSINFLNAYPESKSDSLKERITVCNRLGTKLHLLSEAISQSKGAPGGWSLNQILYDVGFRISSFTLPHFGFSVLLDDQEKNLCTAMNKCKEVQAQFQEKDDKLWIGEKNTIELGLKKFGDVTGLTKLFTKFDEATGFTKGIAKIGREIGIKMGITKLYEIPQVDLKKSSFKVMGKNVMDGVDGSSSLENMRWVNEGVDQFIERARSLNPPLPKGHIDEMVRASEQLEKAQQLAKKLDLTITLSQNTHEDFEATSNQKLNTQGRIADLSSEIRQQIANLSFGERMLIPGGFRTKDGQHSVMYEVQNTGATYKLKMINADLPSGDKISDLVIDNVPKEKILNFEAIQKMIETAVDPRTDIVAGKKALVEIMKQFGEPLEVNRGGHDKISQDVTTDASTNWLSTTLTSPLLFKSFQTYMTHAGVSKLKYMEEEMNNDPTKQTTAEALVGRVSNTLNTPLKDDSVVKRVKEVGIGILGKSKKVLQDVLVTKKKAIDAKPITNKEREISELSEKAKKVKGEVEALSTKIKALPELPNVVPNTSFITRLLPQRNEKATLKRDLEKLQEQHIALEVQLIKEKAALEKMTNANSVSQQEHDAYDAFVKSLD